MFSNMGKFHIADILFIVLLLCNGYMQFCMCANSSFGCIDGERQALLMFKQSLEYEDPSAIISYWEGTDCCTWEGVICDGSTGHIVTFQYRGMLPHVGVQIIKLRDIEWISSLTSLQYLEITDVDLSGLRNLFQVLSMLPSLSVLHLSWCVLDNFYMSPSQLNSTTFSNIQDLDLRGNSFQGPFPSILQNMTSLRFLDLSSNSFQGPFPSILQNMTSLRFLDLSYNHFNSSVPHWLGNLKNLQHLALSTNWFDSIEGGMSTILWNRCSLKLLDLSYNKFNNELLESGRNVSGCVGYDLEELGLDGNKFSGQIPGWLGSLTNLKNLGLEANSFYGPIPTSIQSLSNLEELYLGDNHLNGTIPAALGKLSRLRELSLYKNQLSGVVPDSIGQLLKLEMLDLSFNHLEGFLSEIHLSNLSKLQIFVIGSSNLTVKVEPGWVPSFQLVYIGMRSCKMVTQVPRWLETQKKLITLDLSYCSISGPIPKWLLNLHVSTLSLSHNQITGPLPQNIGDAMPMLANLNLAYNLINGSIPSSLCRMKSLQILSLSGNMLSGDIPNCWSDFQVLFTIKLSSNKLTGVIPSSIGCLSGLSWLNLNNNSLEGELPLSLRNCTELKALNLGENGFYGNIPTWIGESLLQLQMLRLRNNSFDGHIPLQLCQLSSLKILDLADNNLSETIPHCFGDLSGMFSPQANVNGYDVEWLYENVVVVIQGRGIEYTRVLQFFKNMDLSSNNLVGMIPEELTNLHGLLGLNLSHNHLTGNIPNDIGNMKSLVSLDFSRNQLSGNIPTSISELTSLSHLNLSHNSFSGHIPTGHQLQTLVDPSIYAGNPKLCGDPLPKRCPGDKPPQVLAPTSHEENNEEDKSDKVWFYFAITLGYATGLWAVIGVLMFKKNWRYAYFRFADETKDWIYVAIAVNAARLKKNIMGRNRSIE